MSLAEQDIHQHRLDNAAYEGWCRDDEVVDGVTYHVFGVEDRSTAADVLEARCVALTGDERRSVVIEVIKRAPELSLARAGALVRSAYFHVFLQHNACHRVSEFVLRDPATGEVCTVPQTAC